MIASLLRLVLALTLAFNGISAPMAMAHASHAGPASAGAGPDGGPHAEHHAGHGLPAHEGHGQDHGIPTADTAPADAIAGEGCCDGPECRCGCILPPAVPLAHAIATRQELPQLATAAGVAVAPSIPLAAPFRPPSR